LRTRKREKREEEGKWRLHKNEENLKREESFSL
jgi:hypothetical protein